MAYDVRQMVALGVASLDDDLPGWERKVNLEMLDIQFENKCILAQLYGHHVTGFHRLGLGDDGDITHGFRHNPYSKVSGEEQYAALNAEWRRVIEERVLQASL